MDTAKMHTRLTADQITKMVRDNPCKRPVDKDGNPLPDVVMLAPARGAFVKLGKRPVDKAGKEKGWEITFLFAPGTDIAPLTQCYAEKLAKEFPNNPKGAGMKHPIKDQAVGVAPLEGGQNVNGKTYQGYQAGAYCVRAGASKFRPALAVLRNGRVEDFVIAPGESEESFAARIDSEFYPGAWYIAVINPFKYAADGNTGVSFGIKTVVKVCDDNKLASDGPSASSMVSGIQIDNSLNVASLFENAQAPVDPMAALGLN